MEGGGRKLSKSGVTRKERKEFSNQINAPNGRLLLRKGGKGRDRSSIKRGEDIRGEADQSSGPGGGRKKKKKPLGPLVIADGGGGGKKVRGKWTLSKVRWRKKKKEKSRTLPDRRKKNRENGKGKREKENRRNLHIRPGGGGGGPTNTPFDKRGEKRVSQ